MFVLVSNDDTESFIIFIPDGVGTRVTIRVQYEKITKHVA